MRDNSPKDPHQRLALRVSSALFLLVAACSGDDEADTGATGTTGATSTSTTTTSTSTTNSATTTSAMTAGTTSTSTSTSTTTTTSVSESDTDLTTSSSTTSACAGNEELCGDSCIDTQSDHDNCGSCGMACGADEECLAGLCNPICGPGETYCADTCVDTASDPENCGGCGLACGMGEVCGDSTCMIECPMGQDLCGESCVDLQTDNNNCGGCDVTCTMCETCSGTCEANPAPVAPGAVTGPTMLCANANGDYEIMPVMGATKYTWTVPGDAMITMGQDTTKVSVKFGKTQGKVCVSYSDGCADSAQTCVDVALAGGMGGTQTFGFNGGVQQFVVPMCISSLTVEASGAQGGGAKCCDNSIQDDGGRGGYTKGTITVTPGETLYVFVGGKGQTEGPAGFNGGGAGGQWGAGGGGASDVRKGGQTLTDRVIVGGGGGGGNCGCPEHGAGGDGGGLNGVAGSNGGGGFNPGGGAAQNAGGAAGSNPGAAGVLGVGGGTQNSNYHIGAGGGGYYGGGGAYAAGGGGGSSYYGAAMNPTTTPGQRAGDGEVKLTW